MSDNANPYQSPQAPANPLGGLNAQGTLTGTMLAWLREASPWLRFVGIVYFIGCGFLVMVGIVFLAIPGLSFSTLDFLDEVGGFSRFIGILYLGLAVLAFFPARFIYGFGNRIRLYLRSGAEGDLEMALKNNKSLWKFTGIVLIVNLALVPAAIVVGVVVMVASLLS